MHGATVVIPVPNWEEREIMGSRINHSSCLRHVNCEYVCADVDEEGQQTVMVRSTRDVCMGEEFFDALWSTVYLSAVGGV